jgi:ubiquitin-conjugating enzyme E2 I
MSSTAKARLAEERKSLRKDKPFGFIAKPDQNLDGSINLMKWVCKIPGKADTNWAGGMYPLDIIFSEGYPAKPPLCKFPAGFFHPNVYPSGQVCLSIINEYGDWKPSITIKAIMLGIQELLDTPNVRSPAQAEANQLYQHQRSHYDKRVKQQAKQYTPVD